MGMSEAIQTTSPGNGATGMTRQRHILGYFIGVWLILLAGFLAVANWSDARTVAYHEKLFNDQQALQVLLARRGFVDRLHWMETHLRSVARVAVPRDPLRPEGALMTVSRRLFEHPGILGAKLTGADADTHWLAPDADPGLDLLGRLDGFAQTLVGLSPTPEVWVSDFILRQDRQFAGIAVPVPRPTPGNQPRWLVAVFDLWILLN